MKGERKKHKFQKGNTFPQGNSLVPRDEPMAWAIRMSETNFRHITRVSADGNSIFIPNSDLESSGVKLLRPKRECFDDIDNSIDNSSSEARALDVAKTIEMVSDICNKHICENANFVLDNEKQRGFGCIWVLKCVTCGFLSQPYRLYKELNTDPSKRGPKSVAMNYALPAGLVHTNMGNSKARLLFSALGIPPPSPTTLKKCSNSVGDEIIKLTDTDLAQRLQDLGQTFPVLNVQLDASYQSLCIAGRHKLGQNASQVLGVACEDMSNVNKVVSYAFHNKLCWTGAWLRGRGYDVSCPGGHVDCTANINPAEPFTEKALGREIGQKFLTSKVSIKHATTDGDATSAKGLESALNSKVVRLADPVHKSQSQFRQGLKAVFSEDMFPGRTLAEKLEHKKILCMDIKERSHAILQKLFSKFKGDTDKISPMLANIVDKCVKCYSGVCGRSCSRSLILCGGGKTNSWWAKSALLSSYGLKPGSFHVSQYDSQVLTELLELKLSVRALEETKLNTSTQKCEAVNKAVSASLPKNKTYSRNAKSRACAALLRVNTDVWVAITKSLKAVGAPMSGTSKCLNTLKKMKAETEYDRKYKNKIQFLQRRAAARRRQAREYIKFKRQKHAASDYIKDQLEPKMSPNKSPARNTDHTYCKQI